MEPSPGSRFFELSNPYRFILFFSGLLVLVKVLIDYPTPTIVTNHQGWLFLPTDWPVSHFTGTIIPFYLDKAFAA